MSISSFEELELEQFDEELLNLSSLWSEQGSFNENSEFFENLNNLNPEQVKKACAELVRQNKQIEKKYERNKKKSRIFSDRLQVKEKIITDLKVKTRDLESNLKSFDRNVDKIKDQSIEIEELKQEVKRKIRLINGLEEKARNLKANHYLAEERNTFMANMKDELHNKIIAFNELDEMFRLNEKQLKLLKENYSNLEYVIGENERKFIQKEKNYKSEKEAFQTEIEKKKTALENMKSKIKDLNSKPANLENIKKLQSENQFNLQKLKEKESRIETLENSNKQLTEDLQIQKNNIVKLETEIKNIKLLNFGTSNKKSSNDISTFKPKISLKEKSDLPLWWKGHMI